MTELAKLVERFASVGTSPATEIAGLSLYRQTKATELAPCMCEPSLCVVAQGAKQVLIGEDVLQYDASTFLLVSADLPVTARVVEASLERPYLSLSVRLDQAVVCDVAAQLTPATAPTRLIAAAAVSPAEPALLDAVQRLVGLLETPDDRAVLAPLVLREITYRLLTGAQGERIRQIATTAGHARRILGTLRWLREHFAEPLRIEELARDAHMSSSALFQHFKTVTSMSPLQYQKLLRLHEARRLMLGLGLGAAEASFRVGYESPSQFSREYRRLFGAPPRKDVESLRRSVPVVAV